MNEYLISMFVDDELDLDEKIEFVETVHENKKFKDETVELLEQEKLLQSDMVTALPEMSMPETPIPERTIPEKTRSTPGLFKLWFGPFAGFATAMALAAGLFLVRPAPGPTPVISQAELHRFVLYLPDADQAEIIGTFTDWSPVALEKIGTSGYWAISLKLPKGEHRYSYLIENGRQIADPTVLTREQDDFGGENSVIQVAAL
ncbi:MAG: glycogen-binding domain-containing protein [Desulfobulbaceae bacterium]|nr:glycogen-binding domain-containing protein [Desulfobulbaceae bacterium]